jgi:hypothetical protein
MPAIKEYDTKLDSKKRVTLRHAVFEYYHVVQFQDGSIKLEPRELTAPFQISEGTLSMMDTAMDNVKAGRVSEGIDLSEF